MKRILVIAILISYSIASFGVSLNYFYCCGKLKTVSFTANNEEKSCKSKSKTGCCDNKTVIVKLKTDQKSGEQTTFKFNFPPSPVIAHIDSYIIANIAINGNINSLYKRPPPTNLPSRNILFCVFRI